jgi:hypothetical protein
MYPSGFEPGSPGPMSSSIATRLHLHQLPNFKKTKQFEINIFEAIRINKLDSNSSLTFLFFFLSFSLPFFSYQIWMWIQSDPDLIRIWSKSDLDQIWIRSGSDLDPDPIKIGSGSDPDSIWIQSGFDPDPIRIWSGSDPHPIRSGSNPDSMRSGSDPDSIRSGFKPNS